MKKWIESLLISKPAVEDAVYHCCDWDTMRQVADIVEPGDSIGIWVGCRIVHVKVQTIERVNL